MPTSGIRDWQFSYWINQPKEKCGNLLAPCIICDNSKLFYKIVEETGAIPVDEGAKTYLSFIEKEQMPDYNRRYNELSDPIWNKEYLKKT